MAVNLTSTALPTVYFNQTEHAANETGETDQPMFDSNGGIGTLVIVSITLVSAAVIVVIVILVVCFVRKKCHRKKKEQAWVDNLTLSYIADSNIDLTKDNYDEMTSLDNDNFLNSLDTGSFSVWSPDSNTRQYSYSYF